MGTLINGADAGVAIITSAVAAANATLIRAHQVVGQADTMASEWAQSPVGSIIGNHPESKHHTLDIARSLCGCLPVLHDACASNLPCSTASPFRDVPLYSDTCLDTDHVVNMPAPAGDADAMWSDVTRVDRCRAAERRQQYSEPLREWERERLFSGATARHRRHGCRPTCQVGAHSACKPTDLIGLVSHTMRMLHSSSAC